MEFSTDLAYAKTLDASDPLRAFRQAFLLPKHGDGDAIYFLGNSLGLQPRSTASAIQAVLDQWSESGVEAFFKGKTPWLDFHSKLTTPLSRIVGCQPHEIVVMNQLSVNLHLMLASFYRPMGKRTKILCEYKAFPSDQYVLHSHVQHRGYDPSETLIEVKPREGEYTIRLEDIVARIEENIEELALVFWGGVNYYTGQVFDMKSITKAAHLAGALAGFDLAHAAGNVSLDLHDWDVDFACWCSYKYLNSGPGAMGAAFIHERFHKDAHLNRLAGWWGNRADTRFQMKPEFDPEADASGWQLSTPSPILYAALLASLQVFEQAGYENLIKKSRGMQAYLHGWIHDILETAPSGSMILLTPDQTEERGSQISLLFPRAGRELFNLMETQGIYADWREPDVIRVAPVPLYNTFEEIHQFGRILKKALMER
ncbi:MAG TPA: kynureninase, partial [Flavisolibacter sp.]|nr:kynureninase [Flavisolibacter sp.]